MGMALAVAQSTPSSAPTEPSSTNSTSSATGGSTLTAPWLSRSTPSTMRLQQTERQTLLLLEETLVVLVETEEVTTAEVGVVREADEDVQDPEGTRTSKDRRLHPGSLMQQVVDATMTPPPPWTQ